MPIKRKITESAGVYFITFTCHQWKPLIEITNSYDLAFNWFNHLQSKGHYIKLNYGELADINLTVLLEKNAESTPHTKPDGETSATNR